MNEENQELKFQLELSLMESEKNAEVIKRECDDKNAKAWLLLVVKFIIEMVVNSTATSAV